MTSSNPTPDDKSRFQRDAAKLASNSAASAHETDAGTAADSEVELHSVEQALRNEIQSELGAGEFAHEPELQALLAMAMPSISPEPDPEASNGSSQDVGDALLPGTQLGEYRILEMLGSGGMGSVYRAHQQGLEREVAIKVIRLKRNGSRNQALKRFRQEMKAVGKLDHPNIVRAFHAGDSPWGPFLVMERIRGESLDRLIRRTGPMECSAACRLIRQAAEGLDHAHRAGLTHRDIKPSNLMLGDDGCLRILDLGLARIQTPDDGPVTQEGQFMGTVDYMAPEQARNAAAADARSDLYSLGCTLYELLTGQAPYRDGRFKSDAARMLAHSTEAPREISEFRKDVNPALISVIRRLMARDPNHRYASARQLADALDQIPGSDDHNAPQSSVESHSTRPASTKAAGSQTKRVSLKTTLIFIVCIATLALLTRQLTVRTSQGTLVFEFPDGVTSVPVEITTAGGDVRSLTVSQETDSVVVGLGQTSVRIADSALREFDVDSGELKVQSGLNTIRIVHRKDQGRPKTLPDGSPKPPEENIPPAITSPIQIANINPDPEAIPKTELFEGFPKEAVAMLGSRHLHTGGVPGGSLNLTRDGELLFAGQRIWSLESGFPISEVIALEGSPVTFSSDGKWLHQNRRLFAIEKAADGSASLRITTQFQPAASYSLSTFVPESSWLVTLRPESRSLDLWKLNADQPQQHGSVSLPDGINVQQIVRMTSTADARILIDVSDPADSRVVTSTEFQISLNDASPANLTLLKQHQQRVEISENGRSLISYGHNPGIQLRVQTADGQEQMLIDDLPFGEAAVSADGQTVAAITFQMLHVWKYEDNSWKQQSAGSYCGRLQDLALSSDGRRIVTQSENGAMNVWLSTSSELRAMPISPGTRITRVCFSPNGQYIGTTGFTQGIVYDITGEIPKALEIPGSPNIDTSWAFSSDGLVWFPGNTEIYSLETRQPVAKGDVFALAGHDTINSWMGDLTGSDVLISRHSPSTRVERMTLSSPRGRFQAGAVTQEWKLQHGISRSCLSLSSMRYISRDATTGQIILWELPHNGNQASQILSLQGNPGNLAAEAMSPSGRMVVSFGASLPLEVWDLQDWKPDQGEPSEFSLPGKYVQDAAFTSDDRFLICAEGNSVAVYDSHLKQQVASVPCGILVTRIEVHPANTHVAAILANGTCLILQLPQVSSENRTP